MKSKPLLRSNESTIPSIYESYLAASKERIRNPRSKASYNKFIRTKEAWDMLIKANQYTPTSTPLDIHL